MYLGIDIGGTKTIVASIDQEGAIVESYRFQTPKTYDTFIREMTIFVDKLSTKKFTSCGVGVPARLDRTKGIAIAFGNRPWRKVNIRKDIEDIVHCSVSIENDANLAGLSEAMLVKEFSRVLYITISTGIGTGFIVNQHIDPGMLDSEGGSVLVNHNGEMESWEKFASGKAIVQRFGKHASEISSERTWHAIAHNLALGFIDLIAIAEPEIIILGGSVGAYYSRYQAFLISELQKYTNPLLSIPLIREAQRPELAVIYGCFDLIKADK